MFSKKKSCLYLFIIILLEFPLSYASGDLKPINVSAFNYPPFSFLDKDGIWKGADIEITEAVLTKMGYQAQFLERPFQRLITDLKDGQVPMSIPIVEGNNREDFVYFSDPISYLYNVLWKRKERSIPWKKYEDLSNLKIGATKGYHYGAGFKEAGEKGVLNIEYLSANQPEFTNFKKTKHERIDMFISEINVGKYIQKLYSPQFSNINYSKKGVGPKRPFSLAISKKYFEQNQEESKALLNEFNTTLANLVKSGQTKRIFEKYNMSIELDEDNQLILDSGWRELAESK